MKTVFQYLVIVLIVSGCAEAREFSITSPNKQITLKVGINYQINYSLTNKGRMFMLPSNISLKLAHGAHLGVKPELKEHQIRYVNNILRPLLRQKYESIHDNYQELTLIFNGQYSLIFRAYDDGIAYRFQTTFPSSITIEQEEVEFNFDKDYQVLFPEEESFMSHFERKYSPISLNQITAKKMASLPALVILEDGVKAVITEADLEDYCGMYLTGTEKNRQSLVGTFPAYPAREETRSDRDVIVTERKNFLAITSGSRSFPWRVMVISQKDKDLIESSLVYKLAQPADANTDFSWVKPGKAAWDWWHSNNIENVDFGVGINTKTYKYYIDFAALHNIEYIIIDEGWYKLGNLLEPVKDIDIKAIAEYGRQKKVGVILWAAWKTLDDQLEEALNQFVAWGIKGIKVDYMQRDDQPLVSYHYKIAREAAKRKLLVNFHGTYKPTGLYRTFPNVITSEGVLGLEHNKWGYEASPIMAVTLPFTRMVAGPMDYTPGAMENATKESYIPNYNRPMSQGTRAHQLAMYINFESPLHILADSPTKYQKEPECMAFLAKVPVEWDDTKVLDAHLGEYILIARRNGEKWYIGALTNWTARDIIVDFSFLPDQPHTIEIWQDGDNAHNNAKDYRHTVGEVTKSTTLKIHLAPGGGWAAIVRQ